MVWGKTLNVDIEVLVYQYNFNAFYQRFGMQVIKKILLKIYKNTLYNKVLFLVSKKRC